MPKTPIPRFIYFNNAANECNDKKYHQGVMNFFKASHASVLAVARYDHFSGVPDFFKLQQIGRHAVFSYTGYEDIYFHKNLQGELGVLKANFQDQFLQ